MRILGFGTYDTAKHPRVGIVLDGFREHGDEVVEVNAPLGLTTAERVDMLRKPWTAYRLVGLLLARWAVLIRRSLQVRRGGNFDAVVVGYLGHFDVLLARVLFPRGRIVLDLMVFAADTASDRGYTNPVGLRLLGVIDRVAVASADMVIVDTPEHAELLSPRSRDKAVVVPVGAPVAWFRPSAGATHQDTPGPLAIAFFGVFTPLHGAPVIGAALDQLAGRADITVTMIGSGQDLDATRAAASHNSHVRWVEWIDADELPDVIAAHDVCLGIFGDTPKALRVVPNKIYQGAAAGCAVVTSATAPQRRTFGDAAVYVAPGDGPELAAVLTALAEDRGRVADLRSRAAVLARAEFTPGAIVEPLRQALLQR